MQIALTLLTLHCLLYDMLALMNVTSQYDERGDYCGCERSRYTG
jgi:hypothetical protein